MFTKEEDVIHFIFKAFHNQRRIKEDIEMVYHSIMVGAMLKNENCDLETVLIGYLHDIIEDTEYDYDYLKVRYGKDIADGVLLVSEDKTIKDYKKRKRKFLNKLKKASDNILMIELADKLQNLLSDYNLYLKKGKDCLNTEARNYDEVKWYYLEFKKLFNDRLSCNMLDRFNQIVEVYFEEWLILTIVKCKLYIISFFLRENII